MFVSALSAVVVAVTVHVLLMAAVANSQHDSYANQSFALLVDVLSAVWR